MWQKIVLKIRNKKDGINSFLGWFLALFFLLSFLPFISARVPFLNSFFTGGVTKVLFRGLLMVAYLGYSIVLLIANNLRIKRIPVILMSALVLLYAASIVLSPNVYSFTTYRFSMGWNINYTSISFSSYLSFFLSFVADCVFFVFLVSSIAPSIKSKKQFIPLLITVVAICFISILYSFIFELDGIKALIKGGSGYTVEVISLYHSKNSFGLALTIGCFCLLSFLLVLTSKVRFVSLLVIIAFAAFAFVIQCKSSFLCCFFVFVLASIYSFILLFKRSKKSFMIVLITLCSLTLLFSALVFIEPISSSVPFFAGLKNSVISVLSKLDIASVLTRTTEWMLADKTVSGMFSFIGNNEANTETQIRIISTIEGNGSVYDFHCGYITWYAIHGLFGSAIYLSLIAEQVIRALKIGKRNKATCFFLISLLASGLLFMVPESSIILVSCSASTLAISFLITGLISLEERNLAA